MNRILSRKIFAKRGREKGIALLFTLGILGLLTVLALSFAASSMMERKAAQYNAGASAARIMSKAGLNRVIAAMTLYKSQAYENFDQMMSHCPSSVDTVNYDTFDQIYKMTTMADGTSSFFDVAGYKSDDENAIHWIYVYNGKDASTKQREIIGRFAYLVSPAGERLDPAACVSSGKNELSSRTYGDATNYEPRIGISPAEVYIGDLEPALNTFLSSIDVSRFSWNNCVPTAGDFNGASWPSYSSLFLTFAITDIIKKLKWQWDWFKVGSEAASYKEVFWKDDGNNKRVTTEEYARFNLARTDWDTMTLAIMETAQTNAYSTATGLDWLASAAFDSGTFSSAADRKDQVAANIIDYCDSNSVPTSDQIDWSAYAPKYTGNERTPYINEIEVSGINATLEIIATPLPDADLDGNPDAYDYTGTYSIDFGSIKGEVIQIFDDDLDGTVDDLGETTLYFKPGKVSIIYTDVAGTVIPTGDIDFDFGASFATCPAASDRYTTSTSLTMPVTWTATPSAIKLAANSCTIAINSITLKDLHVYLKDATGNYVDYATLPSCTIVGDPVTEPMFSISTTAGGVNDTSANQHIVWEVNDPRQNLNAADWTANSVAATPATIGGQNNAVTADADGDQEGVAASGRLVSTAYIRNEPMKSPWELGAVHRGAKWETINLKNTKAGTFGAGSYEDGDGVLFDEIKMREDETRPGLINLKAAKELIVSNNDSNNNAVLRCLMSGIYVSKDYKYVDSVSPTGTVITTDMANTLAKNIKSYMENNICKNRGEAVNAAGLCDGAVLAQATDAEKEAIVGRSLALTTIEPSTMFKVIVLTQVIKDIGGPSDGSGDIPHNKDFNEDKAYTAGAITPTEAIMRNTGFAWYSPFEGQYKYFNTSYITGTMAIKEAAACRKGRYEVGHDVITGEQKIVAILKYDTTPPARWKVLSYEVVSE